MFNYEELSLEVDWKTTRAIFQIRANHDPVRVTAFLSPLKGRVLGKYDRKRERVTIIFFNNIQTRSLPQELQRLTEGILRVYVHFIIGVKQ